MNINEIYEQDIANFSLRAAKRLGHLFKGKDLDTVRALFEAKMRVGGRYKIDPVLPDELADRDIEVKAHHHRDTNEITFTSMENALDPRARAHEMAHRVCVGYGSCMGTAFNEGVMQLFVSIFSGITQDGHYKTETIIADEFNQKMGNDIVLEGALFDPAIFARGLNARTGDITSYTRLIEAVEEKNPVDVITIMNSLPDSSKGLSFANL